MEDRKNGRKLVILASGQGKKCTLMEYIKMAEEVLKIELPKYDVPIVKVERVK